MTKNTIKPAFRLRQYPPKKLATFLKPESALISKTPLAGNQDTRIPPFSKYHKSGNRKECKKETVK